MNAACFTEVDVVDGRPEMWPVVDRHVNVVYATVKRILGTKLILCKDFDADVAVNHDGASQRVIVAVAVGVKFEPAKLVVDPGIGIECHQGDLLQYRGHVVNNLVESERERIQCLIVAVTYVEMDMWATGTTGIARNGYEFTLLDRKRVLVGHEVDVERFFTVLFLQHIFSQGFYKVIEVCIHGSVAVGMCDVDHVTISAGTHRD